MNVFSGKRLHQNKYILEEEIGRGGFGITYKATNTVLNQIVVIKTLNHELRQDPNFLNHHQQFQAEARRLAKCIHPSIVRVNDFFVEESLPFIVMDYVPGQTLNTVVLSDKTLPEAIALHYIRQVGDAVRTVHQNGLLHRDIKPQNLILREGTQQVVLIDFGIAREFTPGLTQTHTHLASEGYAPIEQYFSQAKRSAATDVYGLAATLYTLLTGKVPIAAPLRDRSPLPEVRQLQPGVSASVNEAVMRGMAMEPQHRPATVDAWLALLPEENPNHAAMPLIGSTSQVATVAVAPAHRSAYSPHTQAETAALAAPGPAHHAKTGRWLPASAVLGILLPLVLGYFLWRSHTAVFTGQSTPGNESSPSVLTESEISSPAGSAPLPEDPSSVEPSSSEAETTDRGGTSVPAPTDEPLVQEETHPNIQPLDPETQQRAEKQAKEAEKRQRERAKEAEKRQREQAKEEKRRRGRQ